MDASLEAATGAGTKPPNVAPIKKTRRRTLEEVRATGATSTIHCAACGKWVSHVLGAALVRCPCGVVITVARATQPEEAPQDAHLLRQISDFDVKMVVDRITIAQLEAERTRFADMLAAQNITLFMPQNPSFMRDSGRE